MKVSDIRLSAIGGTICSVYASLSVDDLLYGTCTALTGTIASFLLSRLLNRLMKRK